MPVALRLGPRLPPQLTDLDSSGENPEEYNPPKGENSRKEKIDAYF